jgi:hypothetical protein
MYILFHKFSIVNAVITSVVFYIVCHSVFGSENKTIKLGGNEANHIDDLKESDIKIDDNIESESIKYNKKEDTNIVKKIKKYKTRKTNSTSNNKTLKQKK